MPLGVFLFGYFVGLSAIAATVSASAQVSVLTQDYDNARSGANLNETILSPATVGQATFGRLFSLAVDEEIFAQPLYVPNLTINGGIHNTIFVATNGNSVYAFDADDPGQAAVPLWQASLGTPIPSSRYFFSTGFAHIGIVGTPVIDPSTNTLYVVATSWNTGTQKSSQALHALDLTTGSEKFGGPVTISAPAFASDSNLQRPGLLLLNGVVYMAFGSHGDLTVDAATRQTIGYNGIVLAYNAATLQLVGSFNAEPGGVGGAFWQAARGLASDGTYIYGVTANAKSLGTNDYAESFVKLNPDLSVADYYQDPNARCLDHLDLDLSASGPLIMAGAGTNLMVGGGKQGKISILLLNRPLHSQVPQHFWGTVNYAKLPSDGGTCADPRPRGKGWIGSTAFWRQSGGGLYYVWGGNDELLSYQLQPNNTFRFVSYNTRASIWPSALAISASGAANGILWAIAPQTGSAGTPSSPATILYAFNAAAVNEKLPELWNSTRNAGRDALGDVGRYAIPTVVNGKVYVASGSNQVYVYGLLRTSPAAFQILAQQPTVHANIGVPGTITDTLTVNALADFSGPVTLSLTGGLPAGATGSISPSVVTPGQTATLTVNLETAVLPMQSIYTLIVTGSGGGLTRSVPIKLEARLAYVLAPTKVSCNPSGNMSAAIPFESAGAGHVGLWLQDPLAPTFPGHLWAAAAPQHSIQTRTTGNWISSASNKYYFWVFDRSNGAAPNFDNAMRYVAINSIYSCP